MKDNSGDEARLRHILDSIAEIESYVSGDTFESFSDHSMKKFATTK